MSRCIALFGALMVVCAGCARSSTQTQQSPSVYGGGGHVVIAHPGSPSAQSSAPSTRGGGRSAPTVGPHGINGGTPTARNVKINDQGALGSNAFYYLNRFIPKIVVEIDAVQGFEPTAEAIDMLRTRLQSVVDKPGGIEFLPVRSVPSEGSNPDPQTFENHHRNMHSNSDRIVLYISYLNGTSSGAIGVAYSSTACAVFKENIEASSTPLVPPSVIERSVIVHEVGHVLSLVNLGYTSPRNHEDQDPHHRYHSNNPDSVMYYAVDSVGVADLLGGRTAPPTDFDANDRADLRDVKDKKLG